MATYYLSPIALVAQWFNNLGVILAGGKINTYLAGTTTPQATKTDITGSVDNANPIILDSAGRLPNVSIWQLGGIALKVVVTDANNNQVFTLDNISGINDAVTSMFLARRAVGNQTLTNNATTTIVFDTEDTDVGGDYDNTTGIFTARYSGRYVFSASLLVQSNASAGTTYGPYYISKNGSFSAGSAWALSGQFLGETIGSHVPASTLGFFTTSVEISLAVNDTVSVRAQQPNNAGGAFTLLQLAQYNIFSGVRTG